jgi:hypothetical protein
MLTFKAVLFVVLLVFAAQSASAQTFDEDAALAAPAADLSLRSHDEWPLAINGSVDLSPRTHDDWAVAAV